MSFFTGVLSAAEVWWGETRKLDLSPSRSLDRPGNFHASCSSSRCLERFGTSFLHLLQAMEALYGYQGLNSGLALLSTKYVSETTGLGRAVGSLGLWDVGSSPRRTNSIQPQVYKYVYFELLCLIFNLKQV